MDTTQAPERLIQPPRAGLSERLFCRLFSRIRGGSLELHLPSGQCVHVGEGDPVARLTIYADTFFGKVFASGAIGFGESYVNGDWDTDDLSAVLGLLGRNQTNVGRLARGFSVLARTLNRCVHLVRRNTLAGSAQNIGAHYDLSNAFYETFLDSSMSYSSAIFDTFDEALETAQKRKIERLLELARVEAGDSVLEIGSGWGALAIHAARARGCRVKTITLSQAQQRLAANRVDEAGLSGAVQVRLEDYRHQDGRFDAIVSCEMLEAVGHAYLETYFQTVKRCLKPGGHAAIQVITIPDERYDRYRKSCDWIRKHIFPGGHLPSPGVLQRTLDRVGGLELSRSESYGFHYGETLRRWRRAFNNASERILALGFDSAFQRKWNYYLSYCEAGFDNGLIDVCQLQVRRCEEHSVRSITLH